MISLEEKFRNEGYDKEFICNKLLENIGISCSDKNYLFYIDPNNIEFEFAEFNKGKQIRSRLYELKIVFKPTSRVIQSFIVKEFLTDAEGAIDLFDRKVRKRQRLDFYENRFFNFIGTHGGYAPRVIYYDKKNRNIITEKYDGSLDELICNLSKDIKNHENREEAKKCIEKFVDIVHTIASLAEEYRPELEFGTSIPYLRWRKNKPYAILNKYKTFLSELSKYKGQKGELSDELIGELRELTKYICNNKGVSAIIHFDPRSENALYNLKSSPLIKGLSDRIKISMIDFESIKLGPLSYSINTALNDFYFKIFNLFNEEDSKALFDKFMMKEPKLWTREKNDKMIKEQLNNEFIYSSLINAISRPGIELLFKLKCPKRYEEIIDNKPLETVENAIKIHFTSILKILNIYGNEQFKSLRNFCDHILN